MSFDEQPDGDIHGECAAEIHKLEAERDALAARLQEMRDALKRINKHPSKPSEELGYVGCRRVAGEAIINTTDTSAQILARRDAATLAWAAERFKLKANWGVDAHYTLIQWADELLKGLEKEQ